MGDELSTHPGAPSPPSLLRTLPSEGHLPRTLLSSPTASVWGVLVCLTQRFRCKSHLIITRVRAVAEMLWVNGAPVRRGTLLRCRGVSGGEGDLGWQERGLGSGSHCQALGEEGGSSPPPSLNVACVGHELS